MSKTIIIIEDDLSIQQMYRFALEMSGYRVQTANNGADGLRIINEYSPDLILLDLSMPVMSGTEMLTKVRANDKLAAIKVFILTNVSKDEAPSSLRLLNVDRYIVKAHHTPRQLTDMIHESLGS